VVIPAFNAARWIGKTLASVQQQTVAEIEIIVVDDGSTDETAEIVERAARQDRRVHLLRQANGGVARARNAGIAAARAEFVAPIDADDLWHPTRLELHLEAFANAGSDVGLVYSPFARIDDEDRVRYGQPCMGVEGAVFERHLVDNFVGNGSGILVRTAVAREVGGYSSALRDAVAEGFEDWLFQLKIAYRHKFVCVPLYLVGYRMSSGAMSNDLLQMTRSGVLALRDVEDYAADVAAPVFWLPRAQASAQFVLRLVKTGAWSAALAEAGHELPRNPFIVPYLPIVFWRHFVDRLRSWLGERVPRRKRRYTRFEDLDPTAVRRRALSVWTYLWTAIYGWLGGRRQRLAGSSPAPGQELASHASKLDAVK
jgi:glycosyltransferase involved in cell wall biosynthesis